MDVDVPKPRPTRSVFARDRSDVESVLHTLSGLDVSETQQLKQFVMMLVRSMMHRRACLMAGPLLATPSRRPAAVYEQCRSD